MILSKIQMYKEYKMAIEKLLEVCSMVERKTTLTRVVENLNRLRVGKTKISQSEFPIGIPRHKLLFDGEDIYILAKGYKIFTNDGGVYMWYTSRKEQPSLPEGFLTPPSKEMVDIKINSIRDRAKRFNREVMQKNANDGILYFSKEVHDLLEVPYISGYMDILKDLDDKLLTMSIMNLSLDGVLKNAIGWIPEGWVHPIVRNIWDLKRYVVSLKILYRKRKKLSPLREVMGWMKDRNIENVPHEKIALWKLFNLAFYQWELVKKFDDLNELCSLVESIDSTRWELIGNSSQEIYYTALRVLPIEVNIKKLGVRGIIDTFLAYIEGISVDDPVKYATLLAGLNNSEHDDYERYLETNTPCIMTNIPSYTVSRGEFTMRLMEIGDPMGPLLGLYTRCCQYPGGAGEECAQHGHQDKNGGFYVIFDDRNLPVAQSWVWYDESNSILCFDNIEAINTTSNRSIYVEMYQEISNLLINDPITHIDHVIVGKGYSKIDVSEYWDEFHGEFQSPGFISWDDEFCPYYTDTKDEGVYCIASK